MEHSLLELKKLSKYYVSGRTVTAALSEVTLSFSRGELVAVTGESGSGKSTLAHVIAGILPYEGGELYVNGKPTSHYDGLDWERYRRDMVSFIAQDYGILPGNSVMENVVSALRLTGLEAHAAAKEAEAILKKVELWELKKRRAARLSSGQKQRLAIARALAKPAQTLIADEPTGNLDPENSQKVIRLLAEAAKERLVILITHDFEEAAPYVTRRITVREGQIASDSQLDECSPNVDSQIDTPEALTIAEETDPRRKSHPNRLGWYTACLQMRSRPIWVFLMTAFFALTMFAVFAILGTFYVSLDDVSTRYYNTEAFQNGDDTRLVVKRRDSQEMTEEDYEKLLSVKYTESLERYDRILDVNYYYQEGIDYEYRYTYYEQTSEDLEYQEDALILKKHNGFVRTVPALPKGEVFLTAGRLPEHMDEVVAVGDSSLLGSEIPVFIVDKKNWRYGSFITQFVTVVGVTDYGSGLYFSDQIGRALTQGMLCDETVGMIYGEDRTLENRYISRPGQLVGEQEWRNERLLDPFTLVNANNPEETMEFRIGKTNRSSYVKYAEVSPEIFEKLTLRSKGLQASLFSEDYSYTDRVMKDVKELGYEVISPYRLGSLRQMKEQGQARMTTLMICLIAITSILVLQILVVRAMFRLEMGSYSTLSDMGLSYRSGQYSLFGQILVMTMAGQILGAAALALFWQQEVKQVVNILKYLTIYHSFLLCALHLGASMVTFLWVNRVLRQEVFPFARREADFGEEISELEGGAE